MTLPILALRQLRAHKANTSKASAKYQTGGRPKDNPKPKTVISLRRADYERQKRG